MAAPLPVPLTFEHVAINEGGGHGVPPLQVPLTFEHVAINEGVDGFRTEVHSLLAVVRDDAALFNDSYFRRDG